MLPWFVSHFFLFIGWGDYTAFFASFLLFDLLVQLFIFWFFAFYSGTSWTGEMRACFWWDDKLILLPKTNINSIKVFFFFMCCTAHYAFKSIIFCFSISSSSFNMHIMLICVYVNVKYAYTWLLDELWNKKFEFQVDLCVFDVCYISDGIICKYSGQKW